MIKLKHLLCVLFSMLLCVGLFGCAKVTNTETEVVEAIIVDVDRDPMRMVGKVTIPPDYDILLKYEDITMWVDVSRDEYYEYEHLIGTTIDVNLVTAHYDDGTVKQHFELIQEE